MRKVGQQNEKFSNCIKLSRKNFNSPWYKFSNSLIIKIIYFINFIAKSTVAVDKNSTNPVQIIKELKNPNETHKYNAKKVCAEVTRQLKRLGITLKRNNEPVETFNNYHFNLFYNYYCIKENEKWCFTYKANSYPNYSYSMQAIEFIVDEIKKDPENILDNLKERLKVKK